MEFKLVYVKAECRTTIPKCSEENETLFAKNAKTYIKIHSLKIDKNFLNENSRLGFTL